MQQSIFRDPTVSKARRIDRRYRQRLLFERESCYKRSSCNSEGFAMAENDAKNWETASKKMVEQRRTIIKALAEGYERGRTEGHIDLLIKIQAAIEALDKAQDEIFSLSSGPIEWSTKTARLVSSKDEYDPPHA